MNNAVFYFTIPAETLPSNPTILEASLISGNVRGLEVLFPLGCVGAVGVRMFINGIQIAPDAPGWFTGNGNPPKIAYINKNYQGPPWQFRIEGYNSALDFAHTPVISLNMR